MPNKTKAHTRYTDARGNVVPSVTTVIGESLGWNKNALIAWSRKMALNGIDPNKAKDEAADIGTLAHYLIECWLKGVGPVYDQYSSENLRKANNCLEAFIEWQKNHLNKIVGIEQKVISDKYGYGGTIDLVAVIDGELSILDYKSSAGIYPEYRIQVSAYQQAYKESHGDCPKGHLLQLGKEDGSVSHHVLGHLDNEWEVFKHCLEIYKLKSKVS